MARNEFFLESWKPVELHLHEGPDLRRTTDWKIGKLREREKSPAPNGIRNWDFLSRSPMHYRLSYHNGLRLEVGNILFKTTKMPKRWRMQEPILSISQTNRKMNLLLSQKEFRHFQLLLFCLANICQTRDLQFSFMNKHKAAKLFTKLFSSLADK